MSTSKCFFWGGFLLLAIYLFVSAPPPLEPSATSATESKYIPVGRMFDTLNKINTEARKLYTGRIVGPGMKAGLKFGEEWVKPGVEQGPLPALFLRLIASRLEAKPPTIGLYLGSDAPINKSNRFTGLQAEAFKRVRALNAPQFASIEGTGKVALYADPASAQPCVTCHNNHADSPKQDWKLNDIMGATTWTYPRERVDFQEYVAAVGALYEAIEESYQGYLDKTEAFGSPPVIGTTWPGAEQYSLPAAAAFMDKLKKATAENVLDGLVFESEPAA